MPEDQAAVTGAAPEDQPATEPDPSMEIGSVETPSDPAATEVGTDLGTSEAPADPEASPEADDETAADDEAEAEAEADDEADDEADEPSPAENQANYVPPPGLSQAEYVQGLMVAGASQGQSDRRKTLARNRERRAQQHAAIHKSDQG